MKLLNFFINRETLHTVLDILGGLRSTCTYVGAHRLKELSKRTTFIRVSRQLNEVFAPFDVDKK